jgi:hypothetical protein
LHRVEDVLQLLHRYGERTNPSASMTRGQRDMDSQADTGTKPKFNQSTHTRARACMTLTWQRFSRARLSFSSLPDSRASTRSFRSSRLAILNTEGEVG